MKTERGLIDELEMLCGNYISWCIEAWMKNLLRVEVRRGKWTVSIIISKTTHPEGSLAIGEIQWFEEVRLEVRGTILWSYCSVLTIVVVWLCFLHPSPWIGWRLIKWRCHNIFLFDYIDKGEIGGGEVGWAENVRGGKNWVEGTGRLKNDIIETSINEPKAINSME